MPKRQSSRKRGPKGAKSNIQGPPQMLSTRSIMRADPVYTVTKRVVGLAAHTTSNAFETFSASGITLDAFDGYSSLTQVFDQYKIDLVEFEYLPRQNVNDGVIVNSGIFVSVVDQDDVTPLSTFTSALAYPNAQVWTAAPGKAHLLKHRFVPRIAVATYSGISFSKFANMANQWIDAANANVPFYGVKTASSVTSSALIYDVLITAQISFRAGR